MHFIAFQPSDPEVAFERDVFLYRAYLAQNKFGVVKQEINDDSPQSVKPLKRLAEYLQVR